jgi:hypothetical protein
LELEGNPELPDDLRRDSYTLRYTQFLLEKVAADADERYEKVRSAVTAWLIISGRVGVVKDIRMLIGCMVWLTKEDVEWEMTR